MIVVDPARTAFAVVVIRDLTPTDRDAAVHAYLAYDQQFVTSRAGFGGSAWLIRDPDTPASQDAGIQRMVQCVLWETRSQADAFLADSIRAARPAGPGPSTGTTDGEVYRVVEVISADGLGRAVIDGFDPPTAPVTGIIRCLPAAGKQAWIDEYNRSETRDHIRHLPGFVSASFLRADRDQRLTEIVQWNSLDAYQAAFRDERFGEHVNVANHYSSSEVGIYHVHRTIDRASHDVDDEEHQLHPEPTARLASRNDHAGRAVDPELTR